MMVHPGSVPALIPELVLDARAELGEGPVWDPVAQRLLWVDILGQLVHRFDPTTGTDVVVLKAPSDVGAVAPRANGGLVLALADGFWLVDPGAAGPRPHRLVIADRPELRFNDGKVDLDGRFWAGTAAYGKHPGAGALFRIDPDGEVETMLEGITTSNGLAWSDDGRTLYYIDSPTRRVDAFDYDPASGTLSGRRTVVRMPDDLPGVPDGMTIDRAGTLWIALWNCWAVHRYLADGTLAAIVRMPVARPTSCAFGGPGLADLYITTARSGLSADELVAQPSAGGLFRVRPDAIGRAATPFAG